MANKYKRESREELISRLIKIKIKSPTKLADALEFRRDQYDLTKKDFAFLLGLTCSNYIEILKGVRKRLPIDATKRAYAIGVPVDVLLGEYEDE
jgi:transcriptional regulator with XRE-family HTH domain